MSDRAGGGTDARTSFDLSLSEALERAGEHAQQARSSVVHARAELSAARASALDAREHFQHAITRERKAHGAHALLVAVSDAQRRTMRKRLEQLITLALRAVFKREIAFKLDTTISRNAVAMTPRVGYASAKRRDDYTWYPLSEVGGGVVDVVAFAFRVAVLTIYRPKLRQVIVADEPFKHVSDDYLPAVATMVRELSHAAGIQMIIVSHESQLASAADRVFTVARKGDESTVSVGVRDDE